MEYKFNNRKRHSAQALPEYALLLVFMSLALAAAFTLLGGEIEAFFSGFSTMFSNAMAG